MDLNTHCPDSFLCNRSLGADIPRPLHIIKRSKSRLSQKPVTRRRSTETLSSDTSVGSLPEPPGGDRPLTIPKKRGNNNASAAASGRQALGLATRPRRSTSKTDPREVEHGTIPPLPTQRPQVAFEPGTQGAGRSGKEQRGQSSIQRDFQLSDYRLRHSKSMLHVTASPYHNLYPSISESPQPPPDSFSSACETKRYDTLPSRFVLVPRIVVTPETKVLSDGVETLWAVVQLSTRIYPANGAVCHAPVDALNVGSQSDEFQYGSLRDVSVEILPAANTEIIEVLDDKASCNMSTLYPGSRVLLMVHVRMPVASTTPSFTRGHVRQSSDDLIQDLEHALGTTMIEYLQVRIAYRHSGFPHQVEYGESIATEPDRASVTAADGVGSVQTRMETMACAVLKKQNTASPWSPRLTQPQNTPLFEIIASHWGQASAREVMHRVNNRTLSTTIMHRQQAASSPPSLGHHHIAQVHCLPASERISEETVRSILAPHPRRAAPPIPKRRTSLHRVSASQVGGGQARRRPEEFFNPPSVAVGDYSEESDPARKIWSQMRRSSLGDFEDGTEPGVYPSRARKIPSWTAIAPPPMTISTPREGTVAVRRLSRSELRASPTTPASRKRSGRRNQHEEDKAEAASDKKPQELKRASSAATPRSGENKEGRAKAVPTGAEAIIGSGSDSSGVTGGRPAGVAVKTGTGAGGRPMAGADKGQITQYYGSGRSKSGKRDGTGKWGWAGWWQ